MGEIWSSSSNSIHKGSDDTLIDTDILDFRAWFRFP